MSVKFIAEAGVNHNGNAEMAFQLVDAAIAAGADAVKFQTFNAEALASVAAPKAAYQNKTTNSSESQLDMLKRLELPKPLHFKLYEYCCKNDIAFLSSPFDLNSLKFLINELGLTTIKVPSGEITNGPFLLEIAKNGCDVILSTGMSTLEEVKKALSVLAFGFTSKNIPPSSKKFGHAFNSDEGQKMLRDKITILHCTSSYPTPLEDANILAMVTMRETFGLRVGFSDHTEGHIAAITSVALGASIVEKHFTLDRGLSGPDHKASLQPNELGALISEIRNIELALGDGLKQPQKSEHETIAIVRKSLMALNSIEKDTLFTSENLGAKRPGNGISPMRYWDWLGQPAHRKFDKEELL